MSFMGSIDQLQRLFFSFSIEFSYKICVMKRFRMKLKIKIHSTFTEFGVAGERARGSTIDPTEAKRKGGPSDLWSNRSVSVMHLNVSKPASRPSEVSEVDDSNAAYRPHTQTPLPTMAISCPGCGSMVNPKKFFRDNLRFCFHTGQWYCKGCHLGNLAFLPSQILTNWNFKKFPVCETSLAELNAMRNEPILDLASLCPRFYGRMPELTFVRKLRLKLNQLAEILFPCDARESLMDATNARNRMHFFGSGDYYSLADLLDLKSGRLVPELEAMIQAYKAHIIVCGSCRSRGNLCGLCNNTSILFPFETESTIRCKTCGHVFHRSCVELHNATRSETCPNCDKMKNSVE
jgi:hypothetical protein